MRHRLRRAARRLRLWLAGLVPIGWALACVPGCTHARVNREACYASAELDARASALELCRGVSWAECPARSLILEDLARREAACP